MPNQNNCQQLRDELEDLKSYRSQIVVAFEQGKQIKDFSACAVLRKLINDLIKSDKTEIGKLSTKLRSPEFKEQKLHKRYTEFVKNLKLTKEQKEKLRAIYGGYDEAIATAKELDPALTVSPAGKRLDLKTNIPSKEQVITNIINLGAQKLEKIAAIMGKPGLIIVPDKSFEEMKDAMNANRHYDAQNEGFFQTRYTSYKWSGSPGKVSVSIMDMVQNPAVVPGQKPGEKRNGEQLRICEKYFRDNGMRLVSDLQYAAGMQQSLRAYDQAKKKGPSNPEKHILDFYGQPHETVTIFNQEHNFTISKFAVGYFDPLGRRVNFGWYNPDDRNSNLRGRGAVQVM